MKEKRFLLFLNHLRLSYSIPKSFALLLSFHVARHSYATSVCLANGVSIENVAKMLGHTNLKQTQHYCRKHTSTIVEEFLQANNM